MKTRTVTFTMASLLTVFAISQQAVANDTSNTIHFSSKLQVSRIEAAKNSTLRLNSMKLLGSNLGSTLRMNSNNRIGGPVILKKSAQLHMASFDLNNARIGGPVDLNMNVQVQKKIIGDVGSDIGIGGVQITADENYNPQTFTASPLVSSGQPINNTGILAGIPSGTIGSGSSSVPNVNPDNSQEDTNSNTGTIQGNITSTQQLQALSQRDSRWSNTKLGNTNLTLGKYGCLVTSLAMLKGTTPDKVNSALVKENGFTREGYLKHSVAEKALDIGNGARKGKNWNPGYDTVAEVSFNGAQHFVVWRTDGTILDPWTGKSESQSKYPLVSFRDYHKG